MLSLNDLIIPFLRKILYRRILLVIIICFSCQLVTSCDKPCSNREKVTLRLLIQQLNNKKWKNLIKEFQSKNPDIVIELEEPEENELTTDALKNKYIEKFRDPLSCIDLVFMDFIWVSEFAKNGYLESIKKEDFPNLDQDFLGKGLEDGTFEGEIYRIPLLANIGVLLYRKDLVNPNKSSDIFNSRVETFEDLLNYSKELKRKNKVDIGYLWQGNHYEGLSAMFLEVLKGYGGFWIEEKTNNQEMQVGLDKPEAIEAIRFLKRTIDDKISPDDTHLYTETKTREIFQKGKTAFLRIWSGDWNYLNNNSDSKVRGKVGIQVMVHAENQRGYATIGGWGLGIAKKSIHKKEALKAIQFFTSAEMQRKSALEYGDLPTRENLFNDPDIIKKYKFFPDLKKVIDENSFPRPRIENYSEASAILQDCLTQALRQKMDIETAMKSANADTEYLLKMGKRPNKTSCNYTDSGSGQVNN
jgi:multiple sugar transport system substrate-binding protein